MALIIAPIFWACSFASGGRDASVSKEENGEKRDAYGSNEQAGVCADRNALLEFLSELSDFRHLVPPYKI